MSRLLLKITAFMCAMAAAVALSAAENESGTSDNRATALQEVVVTARKLQEGAQDVPMAITALDSQALQNIGFAGMISLGDKVSSLDVQPYYHATSTLKIYMRGVGQEEPEQILRDQGVGIYLDDVYVAHGNALGMELGDTERVEVLPGPQGTLYGRNTVGGVIKFISAKPTGTFGFSQSVDVGNFNYFHSVTNVNLPEIAGVSAKFTLLKSTIDGWVDNFGSSGDYGNRDQTGYRAALRWRPSNALTVDYVFDRTRQEGTSGYLQHQYDVVPFGYTFPTFPTRQTVTWRPVNFPLMDDFTATGHAITANWEISDLVSLKSISAYRHFNAAESNDGVESYNLPYTENANTELDQYSQEFLLTGRTSENQLTYHLGVFYYHDYGTQVFLTLPPGYGAGSVYAGGTAPYIPPTPADTVLDALSDVSNVSTAVYANATWLPAVWDHKFSVDLGGRYTWDARSANVTDGPGITGGPTIQYDPATVSFNSFDPSLTIDYKWTKSVHTYAKVATAYRAGGFNLFDYTFTSTTLSSFKPENLVSYEVGLKSLSWDDRLRVNVDAFRENYKDIQLGFYSPDFLLFVTSNAAKATIKGVEGDIEALILEGLKFSGEFTYLSSDATVTNPFTNMVSAGQLPNIPKWKYNLNVEYTFARSAIGRFTGLISYDFHDKQLASSASVAGDFRPSYGLFDARLTLSEIPIAHGDLSVALWGRNLTDQAYQVYHNYNAVMFGEPRTFGLNLLYKY